jgi:NADH:ubiquinone oxidoreductase subunit 6 (subunit J)
MSGEQTITVLLLMAMVAMATFSVATSWLLRAVVGLALTSAALACVMFMLGAPLAGVFELSVCAGLIPAIFLSTISVTKKIDPSAAIISQRQQIAKFWALPLVLVLAGIGMSQMHIPQIAVKVAGVPQENVRTVLWNMRHMDLVGQIVVLLGGALGVVVLLKEQPNG